MKLSFSTKGWHGYSWDEFCSIAEKQGFNGIELHNINNSSFNEKNGAFYSTAAQATVRNMYEKNLRIPCIDTLANPACVEDREAFTKELDKCLEIACTLHIPYVRIKATDTGADYDTQKNEVISVLSAIIPKAEKLGVTIIIETAGIFADTTKLLEVLNPFSCDSLAALWDVYSTYFISKEEPEITIKNLGAYVKHVHVKDAVCEDGALTFCLIGEGELPIDEVVLSLTSVNYNGYASIEWDPKWMPELDDMEIIFSHYVSFMARFGNTSRGKKNLFWNKSHTGNYVWKKETLIEKTFSQVLDKMVELFPDQYAFKYTTLDYTRTYAQFRDDVDTFARTLIALGVKKGDKVAVWATNVPQWFITFWASVKIGAVLVTVNTANKIHEAEYLFRQSDTHTLVLTHGWRDANYKEIMEELCPELKDSTPGSPLRSSRLPFLRNIITVGFKMKGALTWEASLELASKVAPEEVGRRAAAVNIHDVANMQYTSGTTGFPKGVMLTHYNIVNNGKLIGDSMDLSTCDRMMIQVPMFHCFGMVLSMTSTMTHGGTLCPMPYFSPKSSLACINQEKITCFNGVPTMFIAMFNHDDFAKTDFSYMRTGIMAGSNCPADLMKRAAAEMNMREIVSVYGQTEASPGCTMGRVDDSLEARTETVGSAFPNVECKIIDPETGEDCPDGVNGEFVARGYNIMKGYYKMPKATAAAIDSDGWLHTGDLACRDSDGNYRITGRLKDMIIRGGENIYPREIEEFILTHSAVKDVQVIGVPDKRYGEEIMACVILKDGEALTVDELKVYITEHLARHKVPRYIEFVSEFPMNAAGKILKYKMREDAAKRLGL